MRPAGTMRVTFSVQQVCNRSPRSKSQEGHPKRVAFLHLGRLYPFVCIIIYKED